MLNPKQLLVLPQQVFVSSVLPSNPWFCRHCEIEEWALVPVVADGTDASTLKHHPAGLGPATRDEQSSASPTAAAQA